MYTYRGLILAEVMVLLVEQNLGLLGITVEHLQVEALTKQLLTVLPHLAQLFPAILESLQTLAQEHVLRIVLG